jgi:NhaA family Na+:H+ antiporter
MRRERVQTHRPVELVVRPIQEFINKETASGVVLLVFAAVALVWANSPWSDEYVAFWHTSLTVGIGDFSLSKDLLHWTNDGLMVLFFFVVGLEIKRELIVGELASFRQAALPIAAAFGGMLIPALVYTAFNVGTEGSHGWGIPMATDIAFALGAMALLGSRVPVALKAFLVALAIVDDIGAVLVIALFYTDALSWTSLAAGGVILLVLLAANRSGVRHPMVYAALGIGLWLAFLQSGVHATIAGVLLAFTIPARSAMDTREFLQHGRSLLDEFDAADEHGTDVLTNERRQAALQALEDAIDRVETPMQRLEHGLAPWAFFVAMPIFALANAGVTIALTDLGDALADRVTLGIVAGLVLGKQTGVTLFSWLAVRLGIASLPSGVGWRHVYAVGWLAGIGFTMSLFIAALAFSDEARLANAKIGIFTASVIAGGTGYLLLRFLARSGRDATSGA